MFSWRTSPPDPLGKQAVTRMQSDPSAGDDRWRIGTTARFGGRPRRDFQRGLASHVLQADGQGVLSTLRRRSAPANRMFPFTPLAGCRCRDEGNARAGLGKAVKRRIWRHTPASCEPDAMCPRCEEVSRLASTINRMNPWRRCGHEAVASVTRCRGPPMRSRGQLCAAQLPCG